MVMRALFVSNNLIGDGIYISAALREWAEHHRNYDIVIQTLPDHVAPLYKGMLDRYVDIVFQRPEGEFDFEHTFNVNDAFTLSDKNKQHLAKSYSDLLGVKIGDSPEDIGPFFNPTGNNFTQKDWVDIDCLNGCILISMFSASDASRGNPPGPMNKMLPWAKWKPMLNLIRERYPNTIIKFLGAPTDMVPNGYAMDIVREGEYMLGIPLHKLAFIMKNAKMLVTIDNGMGHLAASQKTPTFLMYPRCLGLHYILPIGNPNLMYCHMEPNFVSPVQLKYGLDCAMRKFDTKGNR